MNKFLSILATAAFLAGFGQANATLIGDTVTVERFFAIGSVYSQVEVVTEGLGPEFVEFGGAGRTAIDIEASTITYTVIDVNVGGYAGGAVHELRILGLDWVGVPDGRITGIGVDFEPSIVGLELADFSFGDHEVIINIAGWQFDPDNPAFFEVSLKTEHTVVPLPAAAWMFLTALGGLGLFGWRRRRAAV